MKNNDWLGPLLLTAFGLWVVVKISQAPACGPTCQMLTADVRGILVQDLMSNLRYLG
jgi:hypothetical protein